MNLGMYRYCLCTECSCHGYLTNRHINFYKNYTKVNIAMTNNKISKSSTGECFKA